VERPLRGRTITWLGVAAVAAILVATALATAAAVRDADRDATRDRDALTGRAVDALAAEVEAARDTVVDLRAFFESSSAVTAADFDRFTAAMLAREPALRALAWSEGPVERPPAPVFTRGAAPADPLGSPEAAAELAAARDGQETRLSAPVEAAGGTTAVIVAPVYRAGTRLTTAAARRRALRGFVSATVSVPALARAAAAGMPEGVTVRARDAGPAGMRPARSGIDVAGRHLAVAVEGAGGASALVPAAVAFGGLLLAAAVALLFVASAGRERTARGELARLQMRHDLILSSAGDGIVSAGPDGRVRFVNPAAARMLGRSADAIAGRPIADTGLPVAAVPGAGRPHSGEAEITRPDGSRFAAEFTATPIAEGGRSGAVVTFRDVTARKRLEVRTLESLAAAEQAAAVDPLTGLANHRTFHERLAAEVDRARRTGRGVALVLMDLDHFKRVNDHHGHQTGDRVLERAARVMREQTRSGELIARVGGEEFAMLLPDADVDEALRAAERIRRAVAATDFPAVGRLTVSAGACDTAHAGDADALYRRADGALYWAKHHGRDRVVRWTPDAPEPAPARDRADRLDRRQALVSLRLLARVVDAKDPATRRHSERVGDLCAEIAEELGWSAERAAMLREAGLVHDVGKIAVPDAVLFAPRPLRPDERAVVREHPAVGARIVGEALTIEQVAWVRGHHERWDGTGYPDGLLAEECPEGARILALAEAWDVMTSERPDSTTPATPAEALAECRARAGSQFWPPAVEALARVRGGA
jgi:diguanylate cyclase (GGDEF)-like protein/PAS domain S-box-containing protein